MTRSLAVLALVLTSCAGSVGSEGDGMATQSSSHGGASTGRSSTRASSTVASSSVGSKGSASATSSSAINLCPHLATCCGPDFFGGKETAPASCGEIAAANDPTSCEVALLAMQAYHLEKYQDDDGVCGADYAEEPINPADNPTCEALNTCCPTIQDTLDATTCGFIQGLHFMSSCEYVIAYFKSKGECADVAVDAGTWPGLAPVHSGATDTTTNTEGVATSASHSSSH